MKRLVITTVITFSIIAALALGMKISGSSQNRFDLVPAAQAQEKEQAVSEAIAAGNCSRNTVIGTYSFVGQGTILPGAPLPPGIPTGPYATVGLVTLDGFGSLTSIVNDNFNGNIVPTTAFTGSYTLNKNCTGYVQINGGAPYKFTVGNKGDELFFMVDVPNTIITGTARRF